MLISDLEQLEILSQRDLIKGSFALAIDSQNGIIHLQTDDERLLISELLRDNEPVTTAFSSNGLRGILTALRREGINSTSQSVAISGETPTGGRFNITSTSTVRGI